MSKFFTGDTHFKHANVIRYCSRPFPDVDVMDQGIIRNWNSIVKPEDEVFHVGDFALGSIGDIIRIRQQLNGRIYLIVGNHDRRNVRNGDFRKLFEWVKDYYLLKVPDAEMDTVQKIALFHYPMVSWDCSHHGSWHLHGHCHGTIPGVPGRIDVGVDSNNFQPLSYQEIKSRLTVSMMQRT
jgi:calcineurin-like phosphoesterase family protein